MDFLNQILSTKLQSFLGWLFPAYFNAQEFLASWNEAQKRSISEQTRQAIIKLGQEAARRHLTGHDMAPASNSLWLESFSIYWLHITGSAFLLAMFIWLMLHSLHFGHQAYKAIKQYRKRIRPMKRGEKVLCKKQECQRARADPIGPTDQR